MGPRARDLGVVIGRLGPGPHNTITDVDGVSVGHATVVRDEPSVARTGVTAIWPHPGDPWRERVYAGTSIVNGYGELIGIDQINEWGLLHSPVVITSSLAIGVAYDTTARWIAEREPAQGRSDVIMPVVTECAASFLTDARAFPLSPADVVAALDGASRGEVAEGCVGAGTGMQCFDFKGGIGTASRVVPDAAGDLTVGVLVCPNFGARPDPTTAGAAAGSAVVVGATDAPMLPHQLRRLALRSGLGLARCGSIGANGSGELMLAFSTAQTVPRSAPGSRIGAEGLLDGAFWHEPSAFDPIFTATIEATEEAVVNALFAAETTTGRDGNILHALPRDRVLEMLDRAGRIGGGWSGQRGPRVASGHTPGAR